MATYSFEHKAWQTIPCEVCGELIPQAPTGRVKRYCSAAPSSLPCRLPQAPASAAHAPCSCSYIHYDDRLICWQPSSDLCNFLLYLLRCFAHCQHNGRSSFSRVPLPLKRLQSARYLPHTLPPQRELLFRLPVAAAQAPAAPTLGSMHCRSTFAAAALSHATAATLQA